MSSIAPQITNMSYGMVIGMAMFLLLVTDYGSTSMLDGSVGDECTTPSGNKEVCIRIDNCPVLSRILDTSNPSMKERHFLVNHHCGYVDKVPLVCCPSNRGKCGKSSQPTIRVIGGEEVSIGKYPWMAALGYKMNDKGLKWLCGGSLVNNRHVITAAHCFFSHPDKNGWVVRLGDLNLNDNVPDGASPVDKEIETITFHPELNGTKKHNDIVILRLTSAVDYNDYIRPICLPTTLRSDSLIGQSAIVAGWGATGPDALRSDILRDAKIKIKRYELCTKAYQGMKDFVINRRVICAGEPGKDSCQGDSGGPLMLNQRDTYYLVGVIASGMSCADPKYPGVYTSVLAFLGWITENIYDV